jgi:hypothetical protein
VVRLTDMRRPVITALAAVTTIAALLGGCSGSGASQQAIPRALVVAGGREIVVPVSPGCATRWRLTATGTASRVTLVLRLTIEGTTCVSVARAPVAATVTIRHPLGHRSLVDGTSGARIRYLDDGRLPRLSYLPPGYRFVRYRPLGTTGWERDFTSPARRAAPIQVSEATDRDPAPLEWWANRTGPAVTAGGRVLAVQLNVSGGQVYGRALLWQTGGYRYAVGTIVAVEGQQPLPASQLTRIVDGLRPGTTPASAP